MRDASNSVSTMTQIDARVEVSVDRMATLPTPEGFLVSLPFLSEPTAEAGEAGSGWVQQNDRHAVNRREQLDPASKVTSGPLLPANHTCWIFQADASARAQTHGDCTSGFLGKRLSLGTCRIRPITTSPLLVCPSLFVAFQDRPEIQPLVAIATGDSGTHSDITPQPPLRLPHFGHGDGHRHFGVPFPVL